VLAVMTTAFYLPVNRLPLSTVGAIEFLGTNCLPFSTPRGSPW
jgi:threonine/homoserine efflux transporter RhtA